MKPQVPGPLLAAQSGIHFYQDVPGLMVPPHHHLYHEWCLVMEGTGTFHVAGTRLDVSPGDLTYIARGIHHCRESNRRHPMRLCVFYLDEGAFTRHARPGENCPWWWRWTAEELAASPVSRLAHIMSDAAARHRTDMRSLSCIAHKARSLFSELSDRIARTQPRLTTLAQTIREHPERPWTLAKEAVRLNLSRWWLAKAFRQCFGMPMGLYRDVARVELALRLLVTTDRPVADLSSATGFSSRAHFHSVFKKMAGMTPEKFRVRYVVPT